MRKQKFTRLACLIMALLLLVSGATVVVGAAGTDGTTDKSIKDYADELNTISYQTYMDENWELFHNFASSNATKAEFDATDNWVFTDRLGNTITIKDGTWTMTVGKGENQVVYESLEDAVAAGYAKSDLVYVDQFDGKTAIYYTTMPLKSKSF